MAPKTKTCGGWKLAISELTNAYCLLVFHNAEETKDVKT